MRFYDDPIEISAEVWAELLTDSEVTRKEDLEVLKLIYESRNHEMHAKEIALKLNLSHHVTLNSQIPRFSKTPGSSRPETQLFRDLFSLSGTVRQRVASSFAGYREALQTHRCIRDR